MGTLRLACLMTIITAFSYCDKDFTLLRRHQWLCRRRIPNNAGSSNTTESMANGDAELGSEVNVIKCSCGKFFKGVKGLKMHQRRCRVIECLSEDKVMVGNSNIDADSSMHDYKVVPVESLEYQGIKLGFCCLKGLKNGI